MSLLTSTPKARPSASMGRLRAMVAAAVSEELDPTPNDVEVSDYASRSIELRAKAKALEIRDLAWFLSMLRRRLERITTEERNHVR